MKTLLFPSYHVLAKIGLVGACLAALLLTGIIVAADDDSGARNPRSHTSAVSDQSADWSISITCTKPSGSNQADCSNEAGWKTRVTLRGVVNRFAGTGKFRGHFARTWTAEYESAVNTWTACSGANRSSGFGHRSVCGRLDVTHRGTRSYHGGRGYTRVHWVSPYNSTAVSKRKGGQPNSGKIRITVSAQYEGGGSPKTATYIISYP